MDFKEFIALARAGDLAAVTAAVDTNSFLLYTHDVNGDNEQVRTAMHCATRHGHLDFIKLLVSREAEVYSNPMNTYPAVFWAANNSFHKDRPDSQHIVDYFLTEIPEKADGTGGPGIMINLAARLGYKEIVRKHIEHNPLSVPIVRLHSKENRRSKLLKKMVTRKF